MDGELFPISHVMDTWGCCIAACPNVYVFVPFQLKTVHFRAAHALAGTSISGEKQNYCINNSLEVLLIFPFRLVLFSICIIWSRCLSQPLRMLQFSKFNGVSWGTVPSSYSGSLWHHWASPILLLMLLFSSWQGTAVMTQSFWNTVKTVFLETFSITDLWYNINIDDF